MAPTRELAIQVHKELTQICTGELTTTCVYGGTPYDDQYYALKNGLDIVVGTPGRLIDHIERGNLRLDAIEFIVMDEADQMLDIGFAEDMEKILLSTKTQKQTQLENPNQMLTQNYQTLLFSATMPDWIKNAIEKFMHFDKVILDLIGDSKQKTSALVKHYSLASRYQNRADILGDIVSVYGRGQKGRTIIFVETKAEATELSMNEKLVGLGSQTLHGDISQNQREMTMQGFRDGKFTVLITTNVCARGVDIPEVDVVVNCEPPNDVESYIHRSGRTGRAGRSGLCITFFKENQTGLMTNISRKAGVDFQQIGAPQPKDIIAARASQQLEECKGIDPEVFEFFKDAAEDLLAHFEGDSVKALECAMAMICDTKQKLGSRSLLTANEGFVTLLFQTEDTIRNVGYVKSMVEKNYKLGYNDFTGWRCTRDYKGVVVDLAEKKFRKEGDTIILGGKDWVNGKGISLCVPDELPELEASYGSYGAGRGRGRGGSRGGRGSTFGSRGSSRGSKGRGDSRGDRRGGRGGY
jgi:ATP-dependent RNA helicase DDX21